MQVPVAALQLCIPVSMACKLERMQRAMSNETCQLHVRRVCACMQPRTFLPRRVPLPSAACSAPAGPPPSRSLRPASCLPWPASWHPYGTCHPADHTCKLLRMSLLLLIPAQCLLDLSLGCMTSKFSAYNSLLNRSTAAVQVIASQGIAAVSAKA